MNICYPTPIPLFPSQFTSNGRRMYGFDPTTVLFQLIWLMYRKYKDRNFWTLWTYLTHTVGLLLRKRKYFAETLVRRGNLWFMEIKVEISSGKWVEMRQEIITVPILIPEKLISGCVEKFSLVLTDKFSKKKYTNTLTFRLEILAPYVLMKLLTYIYTL